MPQKPCAAWSENVVHLQCEGKSLDCDVSSNAVSQRFQSDRQMTSLHRTCTQPTKMFSDCFYFRRRNFPITGGIVVWKFRSARIHFGLHYSAGYFLRGSVAWTPNFLTQKWTQTGLKSLGRWWISHCCRLDLWHMRLGELPDNGSPREYL